MRRLLAIAAGIVVGPGLAMAQQVVPRERTLRVAAHAGQELRVQNYASWDRDCQALPTPQIVLRHQPAHGSVSIGPAITTVKILREGAANCLGHQYPGTAISYMPAPGYSGPDQFDYTVVTTRSTAHDTVVVDVRP